MKHADFESVLHSYRSCLENIEIPTDVRKDIRAALWSSKAYLWDIFHILNYINGCMGPNSLMLDFGCGYGFFSALMASDGYKVHGLDVHYNKQTGMSHRDHPEASYPPADDYDGLLPIWDAVSGIQNIENIDFTFYDGIKIPFPNDFFDGVVAIGVLEHIPPDDLDKSLLEINRVLVPGGKFFVFYTPRRRSYAESLSRLLGTRHHDILFDDREFERMLTNARFEVSFIGVQGMIVHDGPGIQWFLNLVEPAVRKLDGLLLKTPLRAFAHHIMCCSEKTVNQESSSLT